MKIALISDVHSNLPSLLAVKEKIDAAGIDFVVSAGDNVGYGADPDRCCDIVARLTQHSVVGNHDAAVLQRDVSGMNPYAATAVLWTVEHMSDSNSKYLSMLGESARFTADGLAIEIHHGSLNDIREYLYEEDLSEAMLQDSRADVLIFGHTHVPYAKRFGKGMIVNPGSVGQPRDGDPRASFGVLDTDPLSFRITRVDYDIDEASGRILKAGLPEMLATRLSHGF